MCKLFSPRCISVVIRIILDCYLPTRYPVTTHFSKRTVVDIDNVAAAYKKVCQIHQRLPAGGILVFLTGRNDIMDLCNRLRTDISNTVHGYQRAPLISPNPPARACKL